MSDQSKSAEEYAEQIRAADEFVSIVIANQDQGFRKALEIAMEQTKPELTYEGSVLKLCCRRQ